MLAALISGLISGLYFFGVIGVFITLPVSFAVALVLGFPIYMLLKKFGWLTWWHVTTAGILCVSPIAILFYYETQKSLVPVAFILLSGALGGILFWWAAALRHYTALK